MREGRIRTQSLALALVDGLMVLLAMQVAWWLRFDLNAWLASVGYWHPFAVGWTPSQPYLLAIFVTLPMFWLILREMALYAEPESNEGEFFRLCATALVAAVLLAAIGFFIKVGDQQNQFQYSRAYSLIFLPFSILLLVAGRSTYRAVLRGVARRGIGQNRILFVGNGPLAEELAHALDVRGTNVIVGTLDAPGVAAAVVRTQDDEELERRSRGPLPTARRR